MYQGVKHTLMKHQAVREHRHVQKTDVRAPLLRVPWMTTLEGIYQTTPMIVCPE